MQNSNEIQHVTAEITLTSLSAPTKLFLVLLVSCRSIALHLYFQSASLASIRLFLFIITELQLILNSVCLDCLAVEATTNWRCPNIINCLFSREEDRLETRRHQPLILGAGDAAEGEPPLLPPSAVDQPPGEGNHLTNHLLYLLLVSWAEGDMGGICSTEM